MKNTVLITIIILFFSCKKQEKNNIYISQNPKMVYDGNNIIDKNRNDSIIVKLNTKVTLPKDFEYLKKFELKTFLISNKKLKIKKIKEFKNKNPFSILNCSGLDVFLSDNKLFETPTTFELTYYKNKTTTIIVEFRFKNEKDLIKAYYNYFNYSKFVRNLKRDKYQFRCSELSDEVFYYTTLKGDKLYLISDLYNYTYTSPMYNIENNVLDNKDIIMDDIFELIKQ